MTLDAFAFGLIAGFAVGGPLGLLTGAMLAAARLESEDEGPAPFGRVLAARRRSRK